MGDRRRRRVVGLADIRAGRDTEKDLARHLVSRDERAAVRLQRVEREFRRAVAELHERHDLLTEAVVRHADHDRVEHVLVRADRGLDLFGEDLLAAGVDAARTATEQHDAPGVVDRGEVAGDDPSHSVRVGPEGRRGLRFVLPVSERDVAAPREQPFLPRTGFELLERVGIEDPGAAVGGERGPVARGARADFAPGRAGLRRAVAVVDQRIREGGVELGLDRAAEHRAAVAQRHQRGEIPPVGVRERGFRERTRHRVADDADRRRALVAPRARAPSRRRTIARNRRSACRRRRARSA